MARRIQNLGIVALTAAVFIAAGCDVGSAKPPVYAVSGKVTVGGKPLTECTIQFVSSQDSYSSQINADGSYNLVGTDGRPGAEAGTYKIVLRISPQAQMKAMMTGSKAGTLKYGQGAPFDSKYSSAETSTKEVEVQAKSQTIDIEVEAAADSP